jgi:tRNA(Ile)-lysidine synthase
VTDLLTGISGNISRHRLIESDQSMLVAVSGGVDSMVLLHAIAELSRTYSWRVVVAHLNHQLRGRSSDADERFVQRAAKKLRLRFVSERADVKALAAAEKVSIEMAARQLRHEFLARTARRLKIKTIAVAHHADDQIELFFLRLLRGTGSEGLRGMKWRTASPADSRIWLIRPLLDVSKEVLMQFAEVQGIRHREDATNASLDFQRNRIRRELLPLLKKEYQPALAKVISRLIETVTAESDFLNQSAETWLRALGETEFEKLHVAVQRRCIQRQLIGLRVPPDFDLVETLRTKADFPVTVAREQCLLRGLNGKIRSETAVKPPLIGSSRKVSLKGRAGETGFADLKIVWRVIDNEKRKLPKPVPAQECFDADRVGTSIILRHWQPGDRFQPIGMPSPVKLQDLFTNQKISRKRRHELVVATTSSGELFWVQNLRISDPFKITGATIRRLIWRWKPR